MLISLHDLYKHVDDQMKPIVPPNTLYGFSEKNHIGGSGDYLFDTPHGRWWNAGDVEPGHSDAFPGAITAAIAKAGRLVDIVVMDTITGGFEDAVINGLAEAAKRGVGVTVRILMGNPLGKFRPMPVPDTEGLLKKIRAKILTLPPCLDIFAASQCWKHNSWNHAKYVAVDGRCIITGGHNYWGPTYLKEKPIFDLSLRYDGPIAKGGHDFANGIWEFVRNNPRSPATFVHSLNTKFEIGGNAPPSQTPHPYSRPDGIPAMWVTNPGWGIFKHNGRDIIRSSMTLAFLRALPTSRHCRITQQSLSSRMDTTSELRHYAIVQMDAYPDKFITCRFIREGTAHRVYYNLSLIDALADFIFRRKRLDIVMSPSDGGDYSNGEPEGAIFDMLAYRLNHRYGTQDKPYWVSLLNDQVTLKFPAFRHPDLNGRVYRHWAGTTTAMANHAKFWMLDSKLFYIGSENLYPTTGYSVITGAINASLQEFGIIAEADGAVSDMIVNEYFNLMHDFGVRREARVSDLNW